MNNNVNILDRDIAVIVIVGGGLLIIIFIIALIVAGVMLWNYWFKEYHFKD